MSLIVVLICASAQSFVQNYIIFYPSGYSGLNILPAFPLKLCAKHSVFCAIRTIFVQNPFKMKETLSSIAARTGYSISTVSRVLSGQAEKYRISRKACKEIMEDAGKCSYSPNIIARNLRTNRTNTIGLILPSVANPYFADLSSVIISEAHRNGYTTIVTDSMENEDNQKANTAMLLSRRVDGIIAVPCGSSPTLFEEINKTSIPVILVDRPLKDSQLPFVTTNNYTGGCKAANLLIRNGHKRIACIQGVKTSIPNTKRVAGYTDAMKKAGLDENIMVVGNEFSLQNGYLETRLLLNGNRIPTAIFALSNTIGLGAMKAIRESGLRIPEDISLIVYDNNIYMDYLAPPVTRISQPVEEMGKLAAKLLFESVESGKRLSTQIELSPELIIRESVMNLMP